MAAPTQADAMIARALALTEQGQVERALDLLYDSIDGHFHRGDFSAVNDLLEAVPVSSCPRDILLGLLTATLPARSRLPSRQLLYSRIAAALNERGEMETGLLAGLE